MNKGNQVLSGSDGKVYINGSLITESASTEIKIEGKFEDVNFAGDYATYSKYMGFAGSGSIKLNKTCSRAASLVADAYKTGIMPDIKVVTALTNKQTGESERWSIEDVVITGLDQKFETKKVVEEELPLKFSNYDILEKISDPNATT